MIHRSLCKVSSEEWLVAGDGAPPSSSVRSPLLVDGCEVFVDMVVPLSQEDIEAQLARLTKEMVRCGGKLLSRVYMSPAEPFFPPPSFHFR